MRLPPEILQKVKLLELNTRKLVNNIFTGEYHSAFKGQGMTFSEFREYVPGDPVRDISWNITARTGKAHIKLYDEERELTMMLLVDVSGSGDFGSGQYCKGEMIVHLAALLGYSAVKNGDHVGLLLCSDQVEHFVPPKKGQAQVHRILRDLLFKEPVSRKTNLSVGLDHLRGVLKKKATIFVLSDFFDENYENSLKPLAKKHDVTAIVVEDKRERELPNIGIVEVEDAETGEVFLLDTSDRTLAREFVRQAELRSENRKKALQRSGVNVIEITDDSKYVDALIAYFQRRHR